MKYEFSQIDKKWQDKWDEKEAFKVSTDYSKPKYYTLIEFPYPSGQGLHIGHPRPYTAMDIVSRKKRMEGYNVLFPMGWDAFGLPTENYAIKNHIHPSVVTEKNIAHFKEQLKSIGYSFDWSREINTSDPEYYRWTQWCFLQLYKKGLAYRKESYQWWCPVDQTVLANEQVENGCCWRCGAEVEKKKMKQWFFKITDYADELLSDIDQLNWPDKIKTMQKNWIGRSEGAEIDFELDSNEQEKTIDTSQEKRFIRVFTTRPDTIFGATFLVLAPEHPIISEIASDDVRQKIDQYRNKSLKKSEIERQENKQKTGVFTGRYAINPATGEKIPIWVSDYVLMGYGEGAIMAVPAHDERDLAFAEKFDLPVKQVIEKPESSKDNEKCYHGEGKIINSGHFNGAATSDAREMVTSWLEEQGIGKKKVTYKMRDWLISRQRYWGCPIPIAYDKAGNEYPIPEDQLPVIIPEVEDYKPDNSGRSALAKAKDWLNVELEVKDPKTGKKIKKKMTRETDTLDGYACSSWYLWRYVSARDKKNAWDPKAIEYWAPTDVYVGADHAVAHLLYIRFWCKFFADQGLLPFREPVKTLLYNGYINAPDGKKMSKSKGNVIDPLDVIDQGYGADTLRTYEMFIGPYDQDAVWDPKSVGGVYRFLNRCWTLCFDVTNQTQKTSAKTSQPTTNKRCEITRHRTIKKVTEDLHRHSFNTAVSALMEYVNELYKYGAEREDLVTLAKLLKPFAPHLGSEMLEELASDDVWPVWDDKYLVSDTVELVVQVNGKLRARLSIPTELLEDEAAVEKLALSDQNVKNFTKNAVKKVIFVKKARLLNFVV